VLEKWHIVRKSSIYTTLPNSIVYVEFEVACSNSCLTIVGVCIDVDCPIVINSNIRLVHPRCKLYAVCCCLEELSFREANCARLLLSYWSEIRAIPDVLNFVEECFAINKSVSGYIVGLEGARVKAVLSCCYNSHLVI